MMMTSGKMIHWVANQLSPCPFRTRMKMKTRGLRRHGYRFQLTRNSSPWRRPGKQIGLFTEGDFQGAVLAISPTIGLVT